MIKTIIKAIYSAFISIVLIAIILAVWTGYVFISQSSKTGEIIQVIQNIYSSQKSVVIDVIDLSKILIRDTDESIINENNSILVEQELLTDIEDDSHLAEPLMTDDDGDNPLGIVIEPSFPVVSENKSPNIIEESFINEQSEISMNEMDMEKDMNP